MVEAAGILGLKSSVSAYLIDRIRSAPNVEVLTNTEVTALEGETILDAVVVRNIKTGMTRRVETHWVFVCIGGHPVPNGRRRWASSAMKRGTW